MSISDYYLLVFFANFDSGLVVRYTLEDPHTGHFFNTVFTNLSEDSSLNV